MVKKMKKISYFLLIILNFIILARLIDIKYINNDSYYNEYLIKSNNIIDGKTAKRGRILDRNNKAIVDNVAIYNINYRKIKNTSFNDEIAYAKKISEILNLDIKASLFELKDYYILTNDTSYLLNDEEKENIKYRKINDEEIYNILINRLEKEIDIYSDNEKVYIHTYFLMNKGYNNDTKLIKSNVTFNECAKITEENIQGLSCDISWERKINYSFLETLVGKTGKITPTNKDKYINSDYNSDDIVGTSGLEEYYDDYLKGEKAKYKLNDDNSLTLVKEEKEGNDLVLAIDVDIEEKAYDIIIKNFERADTLANTDFFKETYIIISNPNTGELLTLLGIQKDRINKSNTYKDISSKAMISSYTVGSIVKGASHTVGYLNNLIDVGKKINDSCVKLYSIPEKCSFKRLGYIDDISALKMSSNYYQFITAIKSTGNKYHNNMKLDVDNNNFDLYRNVFEKYGLGSSTGIDFGKESYGIRGNKISADLLLNLSIGQYDTYTPLQLVSYINTLATKGKRYALSIKKQQNELIDTVDLDEYYMNRIHQGFYEVVNSGTGLGYTDKKYNAAGKTGTAESYYDKNIMTINSTYIMFAPKDNPKYSVVVMTPNVSYQNEKHEYIAFISRFISKELTDFLFENY